MTPQIFLVVASMLVLKGTLDFAGRTHGWRRVPRSTPPRSRAGTSRPAAARHSGTLVSAGALALLIGLLADGSPVGPVLILCGLALTHSAAYAAGKS